MRTRTSFMVYKREWNFLSILVDKAGIRRDAFLASRLTQEVEQLDFLKTNTDEEVRLITHSIQWMILEKDKVSIALPSDLVSAINEKCDEKNIHRSNFFNRFIQFVNLSSWHSFLMLSNPRKVLSSSHRDWLDKASKMSPIIMEYKENRDQVALDELDEYLFASLDGDPYWNNHLDTFYSSELNVSEDDPRRNSENRIDSIQDFENGLKEL